VPGGIEAGRAFPKQHQARMVRTLNRLSPEWNEVSHAIGTVHPFRHPEQSEGSQAIGTRQFPAKGPLSSLAHTFPYLGHS
jgi:hypothetical protein